VAWFASYVAGHVMESLKQLLCGLRGHEDYLQFDKNRVYLHCVACGYESPGWTVDSHRSVLRFQSRRGTAPAREVIRRIA
jgi:hypothetical protein